MLSKVIEELSPLLSEARVERIHEDSDKNIFITLRAGGKNYVLLIAPERSLPRLHLVVEKRPAAPAMHQFTLYLKSRMTGSRVVSIGQLNLDRIVEIRFLRQGSEYRLIFELIGSASNLIVTDADGKILSLYHPVPLTERSLRPMLPGAGYMLPEKKTSHSSTQNATDRNFPGASITRNETETLSANREAEIYYDRFLKQRRFESYRNSVGSQLKKIHAKTNRRIEALSGDQKSAQNVEEFKLAGDLILANLHTLETGMKQAELTGYDNEKLIVTLDPRRSPARNAEQYFKKYKKAKAGRDIISARLSIATNELSFLQTLLSDLQTAEETTSLLEVRSKLEKIGYVSRDEMKKRKVFSDPASASFRKVFFQGWEIIIGKSAAGNDYITMKIARSEDLWLHAEGLPGSHVLIRNPEGRDVPPDVLAKAASLAAFYSKGKNSGKVSVTYTRARFIKKPKGAKAGLVTLSERKSIMSVPQKD